MSWNSGGASSQESSLTRVSPCRPASHVTWGRYPKQGTAALTRQECRQHTEQRPVNERVIAVKNDKMREEVEMPVPGNSRGHKQPRFGPPSVAVSRLSPPAHSDAQARVPKLGRIGSPLPHPPIQHGSPWEGLTGKPGNPQNSHATGSTFEPLSPPLREAGFPDWASEEHGDLEKY